MSLFLISVIGISIVFFCTTLGASFVFFFKDKELSPKINQIFLGFSSGIMIAACMFSLILPAMEGADTKFLPAWTIIAISIIFGALLLWGIDKIVPHLHKRGVEEGIKTNKLSRKFKMFLAVTIHNIPEGLSVGVAIAGWSLGSSSSILAGLMLAIGIGLQNIPEGAVVSLTYKTENTSNKKSFWLGVLSGAVQPVAAIVGLFLALKIQIIMPWALAFAAGCMIYVIAEEMMPEMKGDPEQHYGVWAFIFGFVLLMSLEAALG